MINRDIFLEYTRKMSFKKHCLQRIHITTLVSKKAKSCKCDSFTKLDPKIQNKELPIAKEVPFSKKLKEKKFSTKDKKYKQLLEGLLLSELKNKDLNNVAAEVIASKYKGKGLKYIRFYYGVYEIPEKRIYEQNSSSLLTENESGEIYPHIICVLTDKENKVLHGFLYPAYREERFGDKDRYDYF